MESEYLSNLEQSRDERRAKRKSTYGVDLESGVEQHLVDGVEALGGMCEKFVTPGRRGPPDRLITWPGGVIHFAETKRPKGGVLFSWQVRDHARRRKMGCKVFLLWTKDAVDKYLRGDYE